MRNGIDTGYEGKFDFPVWHGPPRRPWLLATVPRTGSTFVSHLLWASGCLGAPLEYLNFEPAGPYGHAASDPAEQHRIWRRVLARRTSPNGVFGLKAFPHLMEELKRTHPALLTEVMRTMLPGREAARVVQLRRRDRQAHTISYARALLSGVWRKEQERAGQDEPGFSQRAFDSAARLIESQERAWEEMYAGLRIRPLVIWYEDCIANPKATVDAVGDYLGVAIDPGSAIEVPRIERQAKGGGEQWLAALGGEGS